MKNISYFLIAIFFLSCSQVHLEKEEAAKVIRSAKEYPKVLEYDVYTADPESAKRLLDAGLEEAGIVTVDRTQKMIDVGKPIVHFTEKAKPDLIRIDPKYNVQVVKTADMDLGEILGIQLLEDKKSAEVEYTLVYKNITPFAKLIDRDLTKPKTQRARLSLFDSGWKLDKNPY